MYPWCKRHNLPNNREVMMNDKRCCNGDWVGIICHWYRYGVDEKRNENPTASACKDHGDEFVRSGDIFAGCCREYFAPCVGEMIQHEIVFHDSANQFTTETKMSQLTQRSYLPCRKVYANFRSADCHEKSTSQLSS
jgi:hypothetical protein